MKDRPIEARVLTVLDKARTDGTTLYLPDGQLDRPLYEAVNKVLTAAGGKWHRFAKGFIFPSDAAAIMEPILLTGRITHPSDFGVFFTPPAVVNQVIQLAGLDADSTVLEPSAGMGAIAYEAAKIARAVDVVDILEKHLMSLHKSGSFRTSTLDDFLNCPPIPMYSHVLMNPPFGLCADVRHVQHALGFLKPHGRLVAIMSAGITFRETNPTRALREELEQLGARFTMLPEGSFKESGTMVSTCIVSLTM